MFNQFGDLERCSSRPGKVHSADGWEDADRGLVGASLPAAAPDSGDATASIGRAGAPSRRGCRRKRRRERGFAPTLDRGGMRRAWLRGRENLQKRYLIHIADHNLGLIMRPLTGSGTPRRWAEADLDLFWLSMPLDDCQNATLTVALRTKSGYPIAALAVVATANR